MATPPTHQPSFAMTTPPRSALIIVPRRIGDVLLATPVLRSLKHAWPDTALDALVFKGTEGVIAAAPDVRRILTIPSRPGRIEHARFIARMLRRYDLAVSLVPGDRPTMYAFMAGRRRLGLLLPTRKEAWKRSLLDHWVPFDDANTHTVRMHLALVEALGLEARPEVSVSWSPSDASQVDALLGSARPLAVLHLSPKFNYKAWHRSGWIEVALWLGANGYRITLTGSADPDETAYAAALASDLPPDTLNLVGKLTLGGTGYLLSRAAVYLGPDTAITHMASALGVPTVALYGPTNPVKWGPWPGGHAAGRNPWTRYGSQRNGNVALVQGPGACVPCHLEGCDRHVESFSDCLMELPAARVIAALGDLLGNS